MRRRAISQGRDQTEDRRGENRARSWGALLVFILLLPHATLGITLVQDNRQVRTIFSDGTPTMVDAPGQGELNWTGSTGSATQASSIGTSQLSGTATVFTFSDVEFVGGTSTFDITFSVDDPTAINYSAEFLGDGFGGNFTYRTSLVGSNGALFDFLDFAGALPVPFSFTGTLAPDTYRFRVENSAGGGNGSGGFNFNFQVVPEPSVALLLGASLAVLVLRRPQG